MCVYVCDLAFGVERRRGDWVLGWFCFKGSVEGGGRCGGFRIERGVAYEGLGKRWNRKRRYISVRH